MTDNEKAAAAFEGMSDLDKAKAIIDSLQASCDDAWKALEEALWREEQANKAKANAQHEAARLRGVVKSCVAALDKATQWDCDSCAGVSPHHYDDCEIAPVIAAARAALEAHRG